MIMANILITGACGQLGTELTLALREIHHVLATDIRRPNENIGTVPFEVLDVMDKEKLAELVKKYDIDQIYHLAAILSARGESDPNFAWTLNMSSLSNVMEVAKEYKLKKVYWPSSIAVFGPHTPSKNTPQHTIMDPNTVYGISKLAGERWCEYYYNKYGVDIRSLRYPGLVSYKAKPGGGTTDYAVDIFYQALEKGTYDCFLSPGTYLPMMYIDDAIRATIELMEADEHKIKVRSSYNIHALSFSPQEIANTIKGYIPGFKVFYKPDFRQQIADSWPDSINDTEARKDWGWRPKYSLEEMAGTILSRLGQLLSQ